MRSTLLRVNISDKKGFTGRLKASTSLHPTSEDRRLSALVSRKQPQGMTILNYLVNPREDLFYVKHQRAKPP